METVGPTAGPPSLAAGQAETAAATDRGALDAVVQAVRDQSNEVLDPSASVDSRAPNHYRWAAHCRGLYQTPIAA